MAIKIGDPGSPSASAPMAAAGVEAVEVKIAEVVAGAAANMAEICTQVKESQAKAREMLAKAEALAAKAELAELKEELEDFIWELEERIRLLEKLLAKEGDDVQAEAQLEENIAAQLQESIEELSEKTEKLVAGFDPRREEIMDDKRENES